MSPGSLGTKETMPILSFDPSRLMLCVASLGLFCSASGAETFIDHSYRF